MRNKLPIAAVVLILLGSKSMSFAASRGDHYHHRSGQASSNSSFETRDPVPPRFWRVCATDDGQGRMRPCDAGGG
jgi:hypothetical protein